jgi:hypothetical protein
MDDLCNVIYLYDFNNLLCGALQLQLQLQLQSNININMNMYVNVRYLVNGLVYGREEEL